MLRAELHLMARNASSFCPDIAGYNTIILASIHCNYSRGGWACKKRYVGQRHYKVLKDASMCAAC